MTKYIGFVLSGSCKKLRNTKRKKSELELNEFV